MKSSKTKILNFQKTTEKNMKGRDTLLYGAV